MIPCNALIDLQRPIRRERRRGFQPPWYTVFIYQCPVCQQETVMRASSFRGLGTHQRAEPGVGGVRCSRLVIEPETIPTEAGRCP